MRPLKIRGNFAYRSIRIVFNMVINRFSAFFFSYRPCAGWQLFDLFFQSFALVCKLKLRHWGVNWRAWFIYSYMYNNNNKKEIVWFEFILIYFQFSFVLRYFDLCQKRIRQNKNCLPINKYIIWLNRKCLQID